MKKSNNLKAPGDRRKTGVYKLSIAILVFWVSAACAVDPDDSILSDASLDADRGIQVDAGGTGDVDAAPTDTGAQDTSPGDTGGTDTLGEDAPVDAVLDIEDEEEIDGSTEDEDDDAE